jgi:hypothetical protein
VKHKVSYALNSINLLTIVSFFLILKELNRFSALNEPRHVYKLFPFVVRKHLPGQVLLIIEASRSHSDTPHSVGLLWPRDQPIARDLYLTTHKNTRQTSMPPVRFEPTIPASERPQTHALYRAATVISLYLSYTICSHIFLV